MLRAYFIIALLLSALAFALLFGTVKAESTIPKPSVPEFTLKYVDYSYDVPPTYGIDPYTGEEVMTKTGGHVENATVEVTVMNQPFTSYMDSSGNYTSLYYNIRFKGHYEKEWQTYPMDPLDGYINATHADYTVISMPNWRVPDRGQMDFQVQALIGYETIIVTPSWVTQGDMILHHFSGMSSDWSSTQVITIPESQTSTPSPETTPFPTNYTGIRLTEAEIIIGVAIVAVVIGAGLGLLIYLIKRK